MNPRIRQTLRRSAFLVRYARTLRYVRWEWAHTPEQLREERHGVCFADESINQFETLVVEAAH